MCETQIYAIVDSLNGLSEKDLMDKVEELIELEFNNKNININDKNININDKDINEKKINDDDCDFCFGKYKLKNTVIINISKGYKVCNNCGYIFKDLLEQCPEWSNSGDNDKILNRCNTLNNPLFPEASIGTQIGTPGSMLQQSHAWGSMTYRARTLFKVTKEIDRKCKKAGIMNKVAIDAKYIYKTISETKHNEGKNKDEHVIIRGTNRISLIASCIYMSCIKNDTIRSPNEIAKLFDIDYTELNRGCKTFSKLMEIRIKNKDYTSDIIDYCNLFSRVSGFVARFCSKLNINKSYIDTAVKIAKNVEKLKLDNNHTPLSMASASILIMLNNSDLNFTKKSISQIFGISEVTLNKSYKELEQYNDILYDDELIDNIVEYINEHKNNYRSELEDFVEEKDNIYNQTYEKMLFTVQKSKELFNRNNKLFFYYVDEYKYKNID